MTEGDKSNVGTAGVYEAKDQVSHATTSFPNQV